MVHPLTALNHLLPWLALGLLAGLQSAHISRRALWVFPLAVAVGTALGCWLAESALVNQLNLMAFFVLGLLVALAQKLPAWAFISLATLFGVVEGFGNGTLDVYGTGFWLYVGGVTAAAYVLVTLVTAAAYWIGRRQAWGSIAVRALGSWIMAAGILYGGLLLFKPPVG